MNWVVVTGKNGSRRLRMQWATSENCLRLLFDVLFRLQRKGNFVTDCSRELRRRHRHWSKKVMQAIGFALLSVNLRHSV
jgi:hypothetical protein